MTPTKHVSYQYIDGRPGIPAWVLKAFRGSRGPMGAVLALCLLLAGCASTVEEPADQGPLAFPPPPEDPRFYFERTLLSSADLQTQGSTSRLRTFVTGEQRTGRGFSKPFDVAACNGRIYVSDSVLGHVLAFDVVNGRFFEIGISGQGSLRKALGLNTDARCNLYVVDATASRVVVYDADGQFLRAMGGIDMFTNPSHITTTPDGSKVFVVDTGAVDDENHRIRVFDGLTGEHLYDIGGRGREPGRFNLPRDIELGPDGRLYLVDGANFRIQVLEQDGEVVRTFGEIGLRSGQFSRPKGIGIDPEGRVYVADTAFGNFQIFTPEGQLLLFIGSRGSRLEPARYMLPAGLDVDEDGRVYMVDQFFRKVDIYRPASLPKQGGQLGAWYRGESA